MIRFWEKIKITFKKLQKLLKETTKKNMIELFKFAKIYKSKSIIFFDYL
jgi:hypothetical protein